jgi:hypothetical protein
MSKGWYVKVDTQVVFNVETNIGVVAETEEQAGLEAQKIACEWFDRHEYKDVLEQALPDVLEMGGAIWHRGASTAAIDFDAMQAWSVTRDPDFDPDPEAVKEKVEMKYYVELSGFTKDDPNFFVYVMSDSVKQIESMFWPYNIISIDQVD